MSFSGFPKALGYAFSKMEGYSKSVDIVYPDRKNGVKSNSTIRVALAPNSLVNLRSFTMHYKFKPTHKGGRLTAGVAASGTGGSAVAAVEEYTEYNNRFAPRLTSSIINSTSLYFNNNLVDQVDDYGLLYNTLWDMSVGSEQNNKRFLENVQPLVYDGVGVGGGSDKMLIEPNHIINNWVNFLGTSSCEYLDTNDTGLVELAIRLNSSSILSDPTSMITGSTLTIASLPIEYELDDIYFTYERIHMEDPLYFDIKRSKLMGEGLDIMWKSYSTHQGSLTSDINYDFNVSAQSLDSVICISRPKTYQNVGSIIDGFDQSKFFERSLPDLNTSMIQINGVNIYKQPLKPHEIYHQNMLALNGHNDVHHSTHAGCKGITSFLTHYFTHYLSLNYTNDTPAPMISGLDGKGASFNILWKASKTDSSSEVYPVVFCAKSSVLKISAGKQISLLS
jgi:hypothetical protein